MTGRKPHHRPGDARIARIICLRASADPGYRCWRCGLTYAEHAAIHGAPASKWTSDHHEEGNRASPMDPAHALCNSRAGAYYGNAKRQPTSEDW